MKKLLEVQKQIGTLSKNSKNPFFKSQYLDLTTLLQHVTPLLNEQGLLVVQPLNDNSVTTNIIDAESGNIIATSSLTLPNITDPQKLGSCITYYRRYTLKSLLAIAEEDDDGNRASKPEPKKASRVFTVPIAEAEAKKKTPIEELKKRFDLTEPQEEKYKSLIK